MELTILTKMTNKVTAIVDNLNNERVATIYKKAAMSFIEKDLQDRGAFKPKEQTLSDKNIGFRVCPFCRNKVMIDPSIPAKNVKESMEKIKEVFKDGTLYEGGSIKKIINNKLGDKLNG